MSCHSVVASSVANTKSAKIISARVCMDFMFHENMTCADRKSVEMKHAWCAKTISIVLNVQPSWIPSKRVVSRIAEKMPTKFT